MDSFALHDVLDYHQQEIETAWFSSIQEKSKKFQVQKAKGGVYESDLILRLPVTSSVHFASVPNPMK